MKQEKNFSEVVEAFENLLRRRNVYYIYMASFYDQYTDELCCNLYQSWREWCDNVKPANWICWVKDTDYNPNRLIDWHSIDNEWKTWVEGNLNNFNR